MSLSRFTRLLPARSGLLILMIAMAIPAGNASAGRLDLAPLPDYVLARMTPESVEHYNRALEAHDHIMYRDMMDELGESVKAAPYVIELRFMVIRVLRYFAESAEGEESVAKYETALDHARAILSNPAANANERHRAQYLTERLTEERDRVPQRDELRRTVGLQIAKDYAKEIYREGGDSDQVRQFEEAIQKLMAGGTMLGAPMGAPGMEPAPPVSEEYKALIEDLTRESTELVVSVADRIAASWDFSILEPHVTPAYYETTPFPKEMLPSGFKAFGKALGTLKRPEGEKTGGARLDVDEDGDIKSMTAQYSIRYQFETMDMNLVAKMVKRGDEWKFDYFQGDVGDPSSARAQAFMVRVQEEMMKSRMAGAGANPFAGAVAPPAAAGAAPAAAPSAAVPELDPSNPFR